MAYERVVRNLTKEMVWVYVATILKERNMYAYQLPREIRSRFGFDVARVTVYSVLYRMQREGLVRSSKQNVVSGPSKRFYELTDMGSEKLSAASDFIKKTVAALSTKPR